MSMQALTGIKCSYGVEQDLGIYCCYDSSSEGSSSDIRDMSVNQ